jgi:ribosomal protein L29
MAKAKENFKGMDTKDLTKLLKDKREALRKFSVEVMGGKEKNVKAGKALRKDIARILTEAASQKMQTA